MLSYRHAFHAGNHADVVKHMVWAFVLNYLCQKDKPFYVHDSHAGAGLYELASDMMQKKQEYQSGILRLLENESAIAAPILADYLTLIRGFNDGAGKDISVYPGSPKIAQHYLRANDRMLITDLHGTDAPQLKALFADDARIRIQKKDAYDGLIAAVPPKEGRGAILIDPSYEVKDEYDILPNRLAKALTRFMNGVYIVWYPVLGRQKTEHFIKQLAAVLKSKNVKNPLSSLRVELNVLPDREDGFGMVGSGLYVVNPPYTLRPALDAAMPELVKFLAPETGRFIIEENNHL